jgi:ligand-binding SRPBCC domain-containing protein
MPVISLETIIESDIRLCFDLARSIDLHTISTGHTSERAVAGRTSGLIEKDEFVTWEARHLGFVQRLSSRITGFERPFHFRDEQLSGPFAYIIHDHLFQQQDKTVVMKDVFSFGSPLGFIGKLGNYVFLTRYMEKLLIERNRVIKEYAETDKWRSVLDTDEYA